MSVRDLPLTFAGAGTQRHQMAGRFVRVLDATGDVYISLGGGSELKRAAGQEIDAGVPFTAMSIRSTIAQSVLLVISDTPQEDNTQTLTATVTASVTPANTLGNGGDVSVPAVSTAVVLAGDVTRLAAVIQNISDQEMRIGTTGVGAATGLPLAPGEKMVLATTASIVAYNPHATVAKSVAAIPLREV